MRVSQIYNSKKNLIRKIKENPNYFHESYIKYKSHNKNRNKRYREKLNIELQVLDIKKNPIKDKLWNSLSEEDQIKELNKIIDDIYDKKV